MKIFWSWQSDTPGKTGRHFVRDALDEAVKQLKSELTIDDCERPDELHVDQDRQGVPGSPDLVPTILKKIDEAAVFVADVTAVAQRENGLSILNSNVAIELGYAFKSRGNDRVLLVLNTAYGDVEKLPFDLRHKGGSIRFDLKSDAPKEERDKAFKVLTGDLKTAISLIVKSAPTAEAAQVTPAFVRSAPYPMSHLPFSPNDPFCKDEGTDAWVKFKGGPYAFLRVAPIHRTDSLRRTSVREFGNQSKLYPAFIPSGLPAWFGRSDDAVWMYFGNSHKGEPAESWTKMLVTGEIWTASTTPFEILGDGSRWLPALYIEERLNEGLHRFAELIRKTWPSQPGVWFSAGFDQIQGYRLGIGIPANLTKPAISPVVTVEGEYSGNTPQEAKAALLPLFENLWDACDAIRPRNYGDNR
jgi:hypothetical protein